MLKCLFVCPSQSETSFSIFRRFGVRIKLYYISHVEKKFEENCYKNKVAARNTTVEFSLNNDMMSSARANP
jgi:hypothetical protein